MSKTPIRRPQTAEELEKKAAEFAEGVVESIPSSESTPAWDSEEIPKPQLEPWEERDESLPKTSAFNFRLNKNQARLLKTAASMERTSQQKVIESILWPALEARYGGDV